MLFEYTDFTLLYSSHQHTWELFFHNEHELQASTLTMLLDIIEHHNLQAPLIMWREGDASLSFAALRMFERRAPNTIPALACISTDLATRRALEVTFCVLVQHPQCHTFSCEHDARDWLLRIASHRPCIPPVHLTAPMA